MYGVVTVNTDDDFSWDGSKTNYFRAKVEGKDEVEVLDRTIRYLKKVVQQCEEQQSTNEKCTRFCHGEVARMISFLTRARQSKGKHTGLRGSGTELGGNQTISFHFPSDTRFDRVVSE
jgi:hypothetical protein